MAGGREESGRGTEDGRTGRNEGAQGKGKFISAGHPHDNDNDAGSRLNDLREPDENAQSEVEASGGPKTTPIQEEAAGAGLQNTALPEVRPSSEAKGSEAKNDELPQRANGWIVSVLGAGSLRVKESQLLPGSTSSVLYRVTLEDEGEADEGGAGVMEAVIRLYDNESWLRMEPDLAQHEAAALRRAKLAGLSAPRLLGADPDGAACGLPAVLMTLLPGRVNLKPRDMRSWLAGLAQALAGIHAAPAEEFRWTHFPYSDIANLRAPGWTRCPESWSAAADFVKRRRPTFVPRFIHRDFHPANVLWSGDSVSGIVDWPNACIGPAGADVGHCRLNLAELYGVEAADLFLELYADVAGAQFSYHPYWDLLSLFDGLDDQPPQVYVGWSAFGVTDLTAELIQERLEHYQTSLMKRLEEDGKWE
ncbi:phosphotransferase family protein [Paenibacillus stellifer]|uniref:phosphotransferase family protein n=1 Tax=Paenibacillus stellifer TaxID=169760 RepID=UPI00068FF2A8|nr:aminoglycoside phosphotransferase family protein [Paenibacillus stellifer]